MAMDINVLLKQARNAPRVLRVIAAIALLDIVIILYALLSLSDGVDDRAAQVDQLKTQLTQQQQKVAATRKEIAQLPQLRKLYDSAIGSGLLADQDRSKFVNLVQDLAKTDQLSDFHFKLAPEISTPIAGTKYRLISTDVSLTNTALRGSDVFAFWDEALTQSQAHYRVVRASIERIGSLDAAIAGIKAGTPAALVKSEITFQWQSMRQPDDSSTAANAAVQTANGAATAAKPPGATP